MSRQSYPLIASESDEFSILKDDEVFQHTLCADGFVSGFVGIAVPLGLWMAPVRMSFRWV